MELGALVCTPTSPSCSTCPVAGHCLARREELVDVLPRKTPKREPIPVSLEVLLIEEGGRILFVQRPEDGRMASMWELPTREVPEAGGESRLWPSEYPRPPRGSVASKGKPLFTLKHSITHHRITFDVRLGRLTSNRGVESIREAESWTWAEPEHAVDMALTGMTRKVLTRLARTEWTVG